MSSNEFILKVFDSLGWDNPTKIQKAAIQLIIENNNIIMCGGTITGKNNSN